MRKNSTPRPINIFVDFPLIPGRFQLQNGKNWFPRAELGLHENRYFSWNPGIYKNPNTGYTLNLDIWQKMFSIIQKMKRKVF